jgi:hypothetical protein
MLAVTVVSSSRVRVKTPSEVLKLAEATRAKFVSSNKGLKSTVKVVSSSRVNVAMPLSSKVPSISLARLVSSRYKLRSRFVVVPLSSV